MTRFRAIESAGVATPWMTTRAGRTFTTLFVAHILLDCYGGIWPIFKKLAGLDLVGAGLIATATTVLTTGMQPLFGLWADRGHRRRFILVGAFMTATAMCLGPIGANLEALPAWSAYPLMFGLLLIARLGQALFHPAGASVAGAIGADRRSTFVALFVAGGMIGAGSSQILFSGVYQLTGGHTEWLLLPGLVIFWWCVAGCRPEERPRAAAKPWRWSLGSWRALRPDLIVLYLVLALTSAQVLGLAFLMPEFVELRGYPAWMVHGGAFGLLILGGVLTMVPAGQLADRFGRRRLLVLTLVGSLCCYYALLWCPPISTAAFAMLCLVSGGFLGTTNPLGVALAQHLVPGRSSMISGFMMGFAWMVGGCAPSLVAMLATRPGVGLVGALALLGLTNVVSLTLALALALRRATPPAQPT